MNSEQATDLRGGAYSSRLVVLKLGGSLLDLGDLRHRLLTVVESYAPSRLLLVVGGGAAADLVRCWDQQHRLGEEPAHRLALEAMTFNARFVAALFPVSDLVSSPPECHAAWESGRLPIVHAAAFVPALEMLTGQVLIRTWGVTSDSISAWIADCLAAERLVLLKSVDCGQDRLPESGGEFVDERFSMLARRIPRVEWVNLRSAAAPHRTLQFV